MKTGKILWSVLRIVLIVFVVVHGALYFFQSKLIYHPRPYSSRTYLKDSAGLRPQVLEYTIDAGKQFAYYIPPASAADPKEKPRTLWVCFGGNGSQAMEWHDTIEDINAEDYAYLLIEYPGYGANEGKPDIKSIEESSKKAYGVLCEFLQMPPEDPEVELNVLGHSLGAATGMLFAKNHKVAKIVLAAPFTSLADMARMMYGPTAPLLLTQTYDNVKILKNFMTRDDRPEVYVVHGVADGIIPVDMARALAKDFADYVKYRESAHADHVNILSEAVAVIKSFREASAGN